MKLPASSAEAGFSLVDIMVAVSMMAIVMAMAVPTMMDMTGSLRLGEGARLVERELQAARLKAVTTNRYLRVRFNCPADGAFRTVELLGSPSAPASEDSETNRCNAVDYPFPPADRNPLTRPNHDGPVRSLHTLVKFRAAPALEFWPDGSVHMQNGSENPWSVVPVDGVAVTLEMADPNVHLNKRISVNGLGKIQLQ